MHNLRSVLVGFAVLAGAAAQSQHLFVPSANASADGNSMLWLAGFGDDVRQVTSWGQATWRQPTRVPSRG